jgi:hypothetical protein
MRSISSGNRKGRKSSLSAASAKSKSKVSSKQEVKLDWDEDIDDEGFSSEGDGRNGNEQSDDEEAYETADQKRIRCIFFQKAFNILFYIAPPRM